MRKKSWIIIWSVALFIGGLSYLLTDIRAETLNKNKKFWHTKKEKSLTENLKVFDFSPLVEKIRPAVFNISVEPKLKIKRYQPRERRWWRDRESPYPRFFPPDDLWNFFNRPFQRRLPPRFVPQIRSKGSGFLINSEGYALTNYHVVKSGRKITAQLYDGREFEVEVVGKAPMIDLALLKLKGGKGEKFPFAYLGDSDSLKVGEPVIAIGNAKGLGLTVTAGIVSAIGRAVGTSSYSYYIQTDAAINHGNSGGPLFNKYGEVVGINTAILRGAQGIGFALPINVAKRVLPQLKAKGKVERAQLGVIIQKVTSAMAKALGLSHPYGALVNRVVPGGPAHRAGIKPGDVILEVDGKKIKNFHQLPIIIAFRQPGETVRLKIWRNKKVLNFAVKLKRWSDEDFEASAPTGQKYRKARLGVIVTDVPPEIIRQYSLPPDAPGVLVRRVLPGSAAEENGIQSGDVILEVNQTPIKSAKQFTELISKIPPNGYAMFRIKRRYSTLFLAFKLK